jgi:hypothetical protein
MVSRIKLNKKAKINKAKKICELYSEGKYTIAACCEAEGINYYTFQGWAQSNLSEEDIATGKYRRGFIQEVQELYKRALVQNETNYKMLLKDAAREGLLKRARGITYTETRREARLDKEGNSNGIVIYKTERYIPPDSRILIFIANCLNLLFDNAEIKKLSINLKSPFHSLAYEDLKALRAKLESEQNS